MLQSGSDLESLQRRLLALECGNRRRNAAIALSWAVSACAVFVAIAHRQPAAPVAGKDLAAEHLINDAHVQYVAAKTYNAPSIIKTEAIEIVDRQGHDVMRLGPTGINFFQFAYVHFKQGGDISIAKPKGSQNPGSTDIEAGSVAVVDGSDPIDLKKNFVEMDAMTPAIRIKSYGDNSLLIGDNGVQPIGIFIHRHN